MTWRRILALAPLGLLLVAAPSLAAASLEIFPDVPPYGSPWWDPRNLFWWIVALPTSTFGQLVILFAAIIWPLDKLLFRPVLRTLERRGEKIEGARQKASALSKQADDVLGRYEAAVGIARRDAESVRRSALEGARQEQARISGAARAAAEREVASARAGVAGALDSARASLRGETERLARDAAVQVLGRQLP